MTPKNSGRIYDLNITQQLVCFTDLNLTFSQSVRINLPSVKNSVFPILSELNVKSTNIHFCKVKKYEFYMAFHPLKYNRK